MATGATTQVLDYSVDAEGLSVSTAPAPALVVTPLNIYVANSVNHTVEDLSNGVQNTLGFTGLSRPYGVAGDAAGAVYVADLNANTVVKLFGGVQTTLPFTGLSGPLAVGLDNAGNVYVTNNSGNNVLKLSGTIQTTLPFTGLNAPNGMAVTGSGDVYVGNYGANTVVKLSGGVQTIVGFTGLAGPCGVALDGSGAIYVADHDNNRIVKLAGGVQTTLPFTGLTSPVGVSVTSSGDVYVADQGNNRIVKLVGGVQTTVSFTGLSGPSGVAVVAPVAAIPVFNPRQGTIYNPATLAAGVPVWFHKLVTGSYLALFRTAWSAATVGVGGPQSYTVATESTTPVWVTIEPTTGAAGVVTPVTSLLSGPRVLSGATSYRDFFYTVGTLGGVPHVAHYRISRDGVTVLQGEELLPVVHGVSFNMGCVIDGNWLVVYGTDAARNLYQCRKSWARIGINNGVDNWLYGGPKGFLPDPSTLTPMTCAGAPIVANGPVSAAKSRNMYFLSTVVKGTDTDRTRTGHIYKQRALDSDWVDDGAAIALGISTTWLGGGVYFQPQLPVNPGKIPAGSLGGIPYLSSVRVINGSEKSISNSWGLWPVTR